MYPLAGTPCEPVVRQRALLHIPDHIQRAFPKDTALGMIGAESYLGVPLTDAEDRVLGHLAMIHDKPSPPKPRSMAIFKIFAARAAAELRRMRADAAHREIEAQLSSVFNCTLDAIVTVTSELKIVFVNAAAQRLFNCGESQLRDSGLDQFLDHVDAERLMQLVNKLTSEGQPEPYLWVPGQMSARCALGRVFPTEATLSQCEFTGQTHFTIVLRDIGPRLQAENQIRELADRAEYLEEEIRALENPADILGNSPALRHALDDVRKVAGTDASVLILGETGTGKELFARAIHDTSTRAGKPLVKVNCAALPGALIESELFGHEKGAFTGATGRRVGRFALADGGTIFLDEVGELPLELQAKLLRVLQEGEFEPVGSSQTFTVNVRVITATNRDLAASVARGEFREDLYYRINVFPITIPPLCERGDDVCILAQALLQRFTQGAGQGLAPLSDDDMRLLKSYAWPGNVRELINVIERAVITAVDGHANFERALPGVIPKGALGATPETTNSNAIMTQAQIQLLERENILGALEEADWRIAGAGGAAELLDMKASTLSSRIKSLGLNRS